MINILINKYLEYKQVFSRMIFWSRKMSRSYDFDAHTIYDMLYHKLDRIHTCFKENSHCMWNDDQESNRMRKLSEAKVLARRLSENEYDFRAFQEADERFDYFSYTTPEDDYKYFRMHSGYKKTPERAKMFKKGRDKIYHAQQKYEQDRLFYLLNKYIGLWWD